MTQETNLPYLDLSSNAFSTRSTQVYDARSEGWCARTPYGLAVLRYREVGQLLRDRRLRQGSHAWPATNGMSGSFAQFWQRSIISQEGDTHRALRAIATPALSVDHIEKLIPSFDRIAKDLVAEIVAHPKIEFMQDFAVPFAGQAICILLGISPNDWPRISNDASDLGLAMGVDCKSHESRIDTACNRLMDLADELIARVRNGHNDASYVARLVANFDDQGSFDVQVLRDLIVISIFGGVDTTRSQLGLGVRLFIENPDQWQILRKDLSLVPQAIEEIITTHPTTTWVTREAVEAFEFGGITIDEGETLHLLVHASATDPTTGANPDFDIAVPRKKHFGFGGGAHNCMGQLVARTDMACALRAMASGIASFGYSGKPEWLPDSGNTSPFTLPVMCTPA